MVEYVLKWGIYIIIFINGYFLNKINVQKMVVFGLDWFIIFVDGIIQEVYENYCKVGNFEIVFQGVRNVVVVKWEMQVFKFYIIF